MKLKIFFLLMCVALVWADEASDEAVADDFGADEFSNSNTETETIKEKAKYVKPVPVGEFYFVETFEDNVIGSKWLKSKAKKEGVEEEIAKYDGLWAVEPSTESVLEGDKGLVLKTKAKHHAISARLDKPFQFSIDRPLIIQYEVKFQNPLECGGAYVKLIASDASLNLEQFYDKTGFSIMFGPDKCGTENKYHFIIRFKNPKSGVYEEKHAKKSELPEGLFGDGKTHLFTLIVRPDNSYQMLIDNGDVSTGSLLKDFTPAINPPRQIVDPNDKRPDGWDEREKIADPDAVKPEDWDETQPKTIVDASAQIPSGWLVDEPEMIADAFAVQPEDWDTETDGEWEAPKVENPKCKDAAGCGPWSAPEVPNPKFRGKWIAPLIDNPAYQGVWEPRKIDNPDFFEELDPFKSLSSFEAIGLELWSMTDSIYFDNFIITDDEKVAHQFAADSWLIKRAVENKVSEGSDSVVSAFMKQANDKPWIWAIVLLVVLIPVVLIFVFCCGSSSSSSSTVPAKSASAKKTDAVQPDDEAPKNDKAQEEAEEEDDEGEEEGELASGEQRRVDRGDLEENEADEEEEAEKSEEVPVQQKSPKRRTRRD